MPKVIKKRVLKKKVEPGEEFKSELLRFKEGLSKKRGYLMKIAFAGIVVLVLITGIIYYLLSTSKKAERLFVEGYNLFHGDYMKKVIPDEERYGKAARLFSDSYKLSPDPVKLIYLADTYYRLGLYDSTIKTLGDFKKRYSDNKYLMPLYYQRLGIVYRKMGRLDEALKVYDEMYKEGYTLRDLALKESIEILNSQGKKDESQKRLEILKKEFPDSPFAKNE